MRIYVHAHTCIYFFFSLLSLKNDQTTVSIIFLKDNNLYINISEEKWERMNGLNIDTEMMKEVRCIDEADKRILIKIRFSHFNSTENKGERERITTTFNSIRFDLK